MELNYTQQHLKKIFQPKTNKMKSKTIGKKFSELEANLSKEITANLKRIGRTFTEEDVDSIEFFGFSTVTENEIEAITKDGIVIVGSEEISIEKAINEDVIPFFDAISILRSLEEL